MSKCWGRSVPAGLTHVFCHLGQAQPALQGRSTSTGAADAFPEALKGPWWPLPGHGDIKNSWQPGLAGQARGTGSPHWAGTGPGLGNTRRKLFMLFLEGQEPSWTSVCRNQSPLATTTPSMGDLQPVFPGLTQFQGARASYLTSPRLSFPFCKTPIHRVMVGPLDAVHDSHHCTQLPKCQDLSSTELLSSHSPCLPGGNHMFLTGYNQATFTKAWPRVLQ